MTSNKKGEGKGDPWNVSILEQVDWRVRLVTEKKAAISNALQK